MKRRYRKKRKTVLPPVSARQHQERIVADSYLDPLPAGRQRLVAGLQYAILAIAVIAVFHPVFGAEFVWDDLLWEDAPGVIEPFGIFKVWFSPVDGLRDNHYWPVTYSLLWLEYRFFSTDPLGYHAVSLLMHFLVSALIWRILFSIGVKGAWIAGLLFAVHPIHAEPVSWVISQKDLLSALLQLCALAAWLRYRDRPWTREGLIWCMTGLLSLAAAILSKSAAATLPATLLIIQWYCNGRLVRQDFMRALPFILVGAVVTLAETAHYKTYTLASFDFSFFERLIIASRAVWVYAGKVFFPLELPIIYNLWSLDPSQLVNWLPFLALLATGTALLVMIGRIGNGPAAGAAYFIVSLMPVLGFVDYAYLEFSFVADRYQYLASAGLIAVAAGAGHSLVGKLAHGRDARLAAILAAGLPVAGLSVLAWQHSTNFTSNQALFEHITQTNPTARMAHRNLAIMHLNNQNWQEALDNSRAAIELDALDVSAIATAGASLMGLERHQEALGLAERALELSDDAPVAVQTAEIIANRAMRSDQHAQDPYHARNAAHGLLLVEKFDESLEAAELGLALPLTADQRRDLNLLAGRAMLGQEDFLAAVDYFERAMQTERSVEAVNYLAMARFNQQRFGDAVDLYRELARMEPYEPMHLTNLGASLFKMGRKEDGLIAIEKALELDPENQSALNNRLAIEQNEQ